MRKSWLWLILAISLIANVAFVGGYVGVSLTREEVRSPFAAAQQLIERLGLDAKQLTSLRRHRGVAEKASDALRQANVAAYDAFWRELRKPEPDPAVLGHLTQRVGMRHAAFSLTVADELHAFMSDLNAGQKEVFISLVRSRPIFHGRFLMTTRRAANTGLRNFRD